MIDGIKSASDIKIQNLEDKFFEIDAAEDNAIKDHATEIAKAKAEAKEEVDEKKREAKEEEEKADRRRENILGGIGAVVFLIVFFVVCLITRTSYVTASVVGLVMSIIGLLVISRPKKGANPQASGANSTSTATKPKFKIRLPKIERRR